MIKKCKQCGKDFEPKPRQVFCQECKKIRKAEQNRQYYKRRNPPKPPKPEPLPEFNTCDICGKKFKPSYPREHFCSDDCRYNSPLARAFFGEGIDLYR